MSISIKRAFVLLFGFAAFSRVGYGQTLTPEFELKLKYSDAGGGGNSDSKGFGYDPAATGGIDSRFGEMLYPGLVGSGGYFLAFPLNDSEEDYSEINILRKPTTDTFTLQYTIYLSAFMYPAVLSWDRGQIPSGIKNIVITPSGAPFLKMVDMTQQSSVTIDDINPTDTNYASNWETATITIYYNKPSPFASVSSAVNMGAGLLSGLVTYPNPLRTTGTLSFSLAELASITVSGYDAIGREVFRMTKNEPAGDNLIDLSSLVNAHGAIMLRVDASSDAAFETKNVMLVRE
jgi:hypothetical protein